MVHSKAIATAKENPRIFWKFNELTTTGATGAPRKATAEKGRRIVAILEDLLLDFLKTMDRSEWRYGINRST